MWWANVKHPTSPWRINSPELKNVHRTVKRLKCRKHTPIAPNRNCLADRRLCYLCFYDFLCMVSSCWCAQAYQTKLSIQLPQEAMKMSQHALYQMEFGRHSSIFILVFPLLCPVKQQARFKLFSLFLSFSTQPSLLLSCVQMSAALRMPFMKNCTIMSTDN